MPVRLLLVRIGVGPHLVEGHFLISVLILAVLVVFSLSLIFILVVSIGLVGLISLLDLNFMIVPMSAQVTPVVLLVDLANSDNGALRVISRLQPNIC
jgi:uncharacterized membrane protein